MASEILVQCNGDIKVDQVVDGNITRLRIQGGLFVVKPTATLDPIKVAKAFIATFDTQQSALVRKVMGEVKLPKPTSNKPIVEKVHKRSRMIETGTVITKINNIPITKERIINLFKKYPTAYTLDQMKEIWAEEYRSKGLTDYSIYNKQRAYQKYLENEGLVKQIAGHYNYGKKYQWVSAPFGATPPAKVEPIDKAYWLDKQREELKALRDR